ncbi:hypothetical protein [Poseidonibacter sp.]|uniref:hypothetical protein n=1 Tax=Poseidonibacter sp. TaxID=2321188 RepID=UPI003C72542F
MYKCKAKDKQGDLICNREFDEEEFQISNDEDKCILHCNKTMWHKEQDTIIGKQIICDEGLYKIFYSLLYETFKNSSKKELKLQAIHFPFNLLNSFTFSIFIKEVNPNELYMGDCKFYGDFVLSTVDKESLKLEKLNIFNIHSDYKFTLSSCDIKDLKINNSNLNSLDIQFSFFDNLSIIGSFSPNDYRTIKNINLIKIDVKNECEIKELEIGELRINSVNFSKMTFEQLNIKNNLELNKSKFEKRLDFFDVEYKGELNLEKTLTPNKSSFLQLTSDRNKKLPIQVANRETARIIKDSFEKQNNIIEANKFYALEMKEMEKELKFFKKPFEWLVFKIHGMASNHSQDFLLALFWILNITFVTVFVQFELVCENSFVKLLDRFFFFFGGLVFLGYGISKLRENFRNIVIILFSIINYFIYSNTYIDDSSLKLFSNTLNPFSIMTGKDELSSGILLYKITIAYLIYQLIISIRQNTRRK